MTRDKSKSKRRAKKKYQIEMTSLSIFLWGFCLLFLLGWIFLLGILVGRGFLPATVPGISDLKDQVNKLQEMITSGKNSGIRQDKKEELDPKLAFYERLSSMKEEVKTGEEPARREGKAQGSAAGSGMKSGLRNGASPLQAPPDSVSASGGQFTVQLASLEEKSRAERMIRGLGEKGFDAYYDVAEVRGKTYYRIRCGKFTNRQEAVSFARKLETTAGMKGFVTGGE